MRRLRRSRTGCPPPSEALCEAPARTRRAVEATRAPDRAPPSSLPRPKQVGTAPCGWEAEPAGMKPAPRWRQRRGGATMATTGFGTRSALSQEEGRASPCTAVATPPPVPSTAWSPQASHFPYGRPPVWNPPCPATQKGRPQRVGTDPLLTSADHRGGATTAGTRRPPRRPSSRWPASPALRKDPRPERQEHPRRPARRPWRGTSPRRPCSWRPGAHRAPS